MKNPCSPQSLLKQHANKNRHDRLRRKRAKHKTQLDTEPRLEAQTLTTELKTDNSVSNTLAALSKLEPVKTALEVGPLNFVENHAQNSVFTSAAHRDSSDECGHNRQPPPIITNAESAKPPVPKPAIRGWKLPVQLLKPQPVVHQAFPQVSPQAVPQVVPKAVAQAISQAICQPVYQPHSVSETAKIVIRGISPAIERPGQQEQAKAKADSKKVGKAQPVSNLPKSGGDSVSQTTDPVSKSEQKVCTVKSSHLTAVTETLVNEAPKLAPVRFYRAPVVQWYDITPALMSVGDFGKFLLLLPLATREGLVQVLRHGHVNLAMVQFIIENCGVRDPATLTTLFDKVATVLLDADEEQVRHEIAGYLQTQFPELRHRAINKSFHSYHGHVPRGPGQGWIPRNLNASRRPLYPHRGYRQPF